MPFFFVKDVFLVSPVGNDVCDDICEQERSWFTILLPLLLLLERTDRCIFLCVTSVLGEQRQHSDFTAGAPESYSFGMLLSSRSHFLPEQYYRYISHFIFKYRSDLF